MANETTGIVHYGDTPSPIADTLTRYGLGGELAGLGHNGGPPLDGDASKISGFITEHQLARQLGLTLSTIRRWRRQRYGPQAVTIGRRFYYREDAAQTFAAAQLEKAEAAAEPRRRGRQRR